MTITTPTTSVRRRQSFSWVCFIAAIVCVAFTMLAGCGENKADPKAEAPPAATVEPDLDANNFKVDHPDQFPLVTAVEHKAAPALNVTGVDSACVPAVISKTVPLWNVPPEDVSP